MPPIFLRLSLRFLRCVAKAVCSKSLEQVPNIGHSLNVRVRDHLLLRHGHRTVDLNGVQIRLQRLALNRVERLILAHTHRA